MIGKFIISLDFELHWGAAEKWDLKNKEKYFLDTRVLIPKVLNLFEQNNIRATWATVGFLFAKNKEQLINFSPELKPGYDNRSLNYYNYFDIVGEDENKDPFHFAPSLIQLILNTKGQELGTHTFSHYYCNAKGQNVEQFEADLKVAQAIAKKNFNIELKSLVFPRNQYNSEYLKVAKESGIGIVRSNPNVWFWQKNYGKLTPILRAIDTLFPISKSLCFDSQSIVRNGIVEIPSSRFFRPYRAKEKIIQGIKIRRIKSEMTYAAKHQLNYHLWWHPHNLATDIEQNIQQLNIIIEHFNYLNNKYGFRSASMNDFMKTSND